MRKCEVKVSDKVTCKETSVGTVTTHGGSHEVCDKHWEKSDIRF